MTSSLDRQHITGLVLAGGRGSRMGGVDKGLQNLQGLPLVQHALTRLGPQVGRVVVNANRNLPAYEALGADVWPDASADFAGPLAGFLVGLTHASTPYVLTVPCDVPRLPLDLAARLAAALVHDQADIAMAAQISRQPVFCLMKVSLAESLARFIQAGGRKVGAWTAQHHTVYVDFDKATDDPLAFANVNTLAELQALENAA